MKNAGYSTGSADSLSLMCIFHCALTPIDLHTETSETTASIHKRKKSSALRTDTGGQGLDHYCSE